MTTMDTFAESATEITSGISKNVPIIGNVASGNLTNTTEIAQLMS